ncbi:MAG: aminomethyl-transferring glycine dehydrogenase [Proteobacteria bacterium]|jgi:glycine dehydrogenase|nr:aminomethyl-transferring glycine dehydrogenase [Pseudomonadota bacterium]
MQTNHEFSGRHIGPRTSDVRAMLKELGFSTLEEMASKVIPPNIRSRKSFDLGPGLSEFEMLQKAKSILSKNKITRNYIGLGFHDTITPTVIQRNILENPVWYTAYTPYQAEIAQGRMESLLNFQTMVTDLTAMEISNASLLDEGTAAAEAMAMAANLVKNKAVDFIVDENLHPHVIEVLHTRSEPLGLKMHVVNVDTHQITTPLFAAIVAYPGTDGAVQIRRELADRMHTQGGMLIVDVDLLSLTLLKPPGEWGADIVVGNSQRFGVPLGFGGPHAAFLATKDAHKRLMPGRLVGVSQDAQGKKALRLALQTREQHIRREKATSNICTAQVLLANMAAMYAVYHGPHGLKAIADRIHALAAALATALRNQGLKVSEQTFFDTLKIENVNVAQVRQTAENLGINLRYLNDQTITLSLHEKTNVKDLQDLASCFGVKADFSSVLEQGYQSINPDLVRTSSYLTHPVFNSHHSETELLRYIHHLQSKDLTLAHSMIPLGSCTMKLNATTELTPVSWPEVNSLHPFAPLNQTQGMLELIRDLEKQLCEITGFAAVSLQPNAGSQGEFAGLLVIRKYHQSRGDHHRNICLIPSSAHGTNPASAVMCGMQVVVVACDEAGNVDVTDLKAKAELHKNNLAALMVTYPSTHGVFEESITEICKIIHDHGGQVYMDGANLNALVALCRPGEFGPDVSHMNLHKTFSIPHGGGGPGVGPIGVAAHLKSFLPTHSLVKEAGPKDGISATTSAPWGSASILPISWTYITMMGEQGLKQATLISILNANYIAKKLNSYYPVLYKGKEGLVAHECIIDLRHLKKSADVDVTDVAKRLMDYGFHAPTMSWPVAGTLMIEPTESESKAELDRFIEAMIAIRKEIQAVEDKKMDPMDNPLKNAPHTMYVATATEWKHPYSREQAVFPLPWVKANKFWPAVGRVDNAFGDRNVVCSCPPLEDFQ